jgi:hypothetical protein
MMRKYHVRFGGRLMEKDIEYTSPAADPILRAALSDAQAQRASGGCWPASFGLNRSQSQSPGKAGSKGQTANTPGAVGEQATASVDAVRKAVHPPEPPPFGVGSSQCARCWADFREDIERGAAWIAEIAKGAKQRNHDRATRVAVGHGPQPGQKRPGPITVPGSRAGSLPGFAV